MTGYTIDGIDYSPYNMPILTQLIGKKAGASDKEKSEGRGVASQTKPGSDNNSAEKTADREDKFIKSDEAAKKQENDLTRKPRAINDSDSEEKYQMEQDSGLSDAEKDVVEQLEDRDQEVKQHEQSHQIAGGNLVRGKSFSYTTGPDGKRYAIGGEVQIDISEVPNDPEATIAKMQQVKRAALAPSDPSMQDRAVAARASQIESKARSELRKQEQSGQSDSDSNVFANAAINAYKQSDNIPEDHIGTQINQPAV